MRRFLLLITALMLVFSLTLSASATVSAPKLGLFATVSQDGSCEVTVTVNLHLTEQTKDLRFPIPGEATGVTLNGSRAGTRRSGDVRVVDLNRVLSKAIGDVSFTLHYRLHNVIHTTQNNTLELRLPMLAGFESPIEAMDFSVTLPGNIETLPGFESGYHQRSIEQDLSYRVDGAVITGNALAQMKDHETLTLLLDVNDTMFPQSLSQTRDYSFGGIAMAVCAGLALLYWLIFLWFLPLRRERCTEPPEGRTAGELGCVMHLQGVNLTMTVLSWARLGYVLLQPDRRGRVLIRKRMEMGNERKSGEQRLFQSLFARGDTVDTASARYAQLRLAGEKKPLAMQELLHKRSGNPLVFRGLAAGIGLFGGVCMAISMSGGALLLGLMILVLGALGALSGWYIQLWGGCLLIRNPLRLAGCLTVAGLWLLLSLAAGVFSIGLWMVAGLALAGLLLSWGGRRTEEGKLEVAQIRGLRHYLRTVDRKDLHRLCQSDPGYFFELAPCAIALGLGRAFAKRFAGIHLESCPYLTIQTQTNRTATQWIQLLEQTANAMDSRAKQLPWERLLGLIRSFRR